jgi:exodeoxyribonuclease VII small subunit
MARLTGIRPLMNRRIRSALSRHMPKAAKNSDAANEAGEELSFEAALQKLESVVESMESGDLPLEAMLTRCEEGARLSQICQAKLADADLKIQQLEKTAAGELILKPVTLPGEGQEK